MAALCEQSIHGTPSDNDLAAAPALQLEAGDLVLRDRGYLTNGEIERHLQAGAHCIYRHKTGTTYLNPATRQPLNLLKLLQKGRHLDLSVMLNIEQRTVVRLVAAPVDEATAALRRMRAKKETKGHNPTKEMLALMGWTIFLSWGAVTGGHRCRSTTDSAPRRGHRRPQTVTREISNHALAV